MQQLVANGPKYLRTPESEEGTGFEIMGQAGMARVKEDGSFEFKDVPGANYQLAVSDESRHFAMQGMNPGGFLVLAFEEMRLNS
ncbi:MAG TPA: hypothetical protein VF749_18600 [Candidatus Acidoferrum sp.]